MPSEQGMFLFTKHIWVGSGPAVWSTLCEDLMLIGGNVLRLDQDINTTILTPFAGTMTYFRSRFHSINWFNAVAKSPFRLLACSLRPSWGVMLD